MTQHALPESLLGSLTSEQSDTLKRLCYTACEISLSQMHQNCYRIDALRFLQATAKIAEFDLAKSHLLLAVSEHSAGTDGWGEPLTERTKWRWQTAGKIYLSHAELKRAFESGEQLDFDQMLPVKGSRGSISPCRSCPCRSDQTPLQTQPW